MDFDKGQWLIVVTAILSTTLLFSLDNTVVGFSHLKLTPAHSKSETDLFIGCRYTTKGRRTVW